MKKILLPLLFAGIVYLLSFPVGFKMESWDPPVAPEMAGAYAPNEILLKADLMSTELGTGPEDVARDSSGNLYAGLDEGLVIRIKANGGKPEVFAQTGGRPLGLHFDKDQNLIVANATLGIQSINAKGEVSTLVGDFEGKSFVFADDLDIGADGTIYFSDASTIASVGNYKEDIMAHSGTGRLLAYYPSTGETRLLLDGLQFANGIAVSPDQQYVLVTETSAYRITRYWIAGPKKGEHDYFIENLPGFPDGVSTNGKDIFWVAMANPRNPLLDKLLPHPFIRKIVQRLPEAVQPKPVRYGFALGLNMQGRVVYNVQDPSGRLAAISSVQEHDSVLYLGSLNDPHFGILPRKDIP